MAVSFDAFGTLLAVEPVPDPATTVRAELTTRGVNVPEDWREAYREPHLERPAGREIPLPRHVSAALKSRGISASKSVVEAAVVDAFDPTVESRDGAATAIRAAADHGPVGILSNCSVPGLVDTALESASLREAFDVIITSAACGWRKPSNQAFEIAAEALDTTPNQLVHVGDDPDTDGGATSVGATAIVDPNPILGDLPSTFAEVCPR